MAQRAAVMAYLAGFGLRVRATGARMVDVWGSTSAMDAAFHVTIADYRGATGKTFFTPTGPATVPANLAVAGVIGLSTAVHPHPALTHPTMTIHPRSRRPARPMPGRAPSSRGKPQFGGGPYGLGLTPAQIHGIYDFGPLDIAQLYGDNQRIALFELADFNQDNITTYETQFGLPETYANTISIGNGCGGCTYGMTEVELDIEVALATAPDASIDVYEGDISDSAASAEIYTAIANDDADQAVSSSWGICEPYIDSGTQSSENASFMQMASQGQTMFSASGDSDAYPCNASSPIVIDPSSQPYVTGVGGTMLNADPGDATNPGYFSESVWNDGVHGSGGGYSADWAQPTWQSAPGTDSGGMRQVPDMALDADPNTGYDIYTEGQWAAIGGTSAGSPIWAAFAAICDEQLWLSRQPALGFINPTLYTLANNGWQYAQSFHDITSGDNGTYIAGPGYDMVTGLGTLDAAGLLMNLSPSRPYWYYFTWYDNPSAHGQDYLMISNPSQTDWTYVSVSLAGQLLDWLALDPGQQVIRTYDVPRNGPLVVVSLQGVPLVTGQRIRMGSSFEETSNQEVGYLWNENYFTWYDSIGSPGTDWLMLANPNNVTAAIHVLVAGNLVLKTTVPPNGYITPVFPSLRDGPVLIQSWNAYTGMPLSIAASQRILWQGQFNEEWATPSWARWDQATYTWYDALGTHGDDWILVANVDTIPAQVTITIAGAIVDSEIIPPGQRITPTFAGWRSGPVEVTAAPVGSRPARRHPGGGRHPALPQSGGGGPSVAILTSQRSLWHGNSFEEVPGMPGWAMGSSNWFIYYDAVRTDGNDWIMIINPGASTVYASVTIGSFTVLDNVAIPAGGYITPSYPDLYGGPTHVWAIDDSSSPAEIFTTQRTLWDTGADFNETLPLVE